MDLPAISAAMCDALRDIDNARPYDGYQDEVFTGTGVALVVRPADEWVDYLQAMKGGQASVSYVVEIVVPRANVRASYNKIAELVSAGAGHNRSVIDTLKPNSAPQTLGGVIDDLAVRRASGLLEKQYGAVSYMGVDIDVDILVPRLHS